MAKGARLKTLYRKTILPDGLRIISESIPTFRSISIGLWLDTGSRDEPDEIAGISHFIEHMVFKGTGSRSAKEIASYLESVGGMLNAFTSREQTCYYAKILDKHLPLAVEILADLIFNGRFDKDDIEKEKNIIIDEINEVNDTPADLVHDLFARTIFGEHPLGRPIMGSSSTVRRITREHILAYLRASYRPEKMIVAASGNLVHGELVRLVRKYFPKKYENNRNPYPRKRPSLLRRLSVKQRESSQTHICIGGPAFTFEHPRRSALLLLNSMVGGGMSSKLFQKIREEMGMAYTIFSYLDFFADTAVMGVYLSTDPKNVTKVIATVFEELSHFAMEKLSPKEIESARELLKGSLVLGLENSSNRMNRMAKHEILLGKYISVDETIAEIDSVTAENVRQVAEKLFDPKRFTITALGQTKKSAILRALPDGVG